MLSNYWAASVRCWKRMGHSRLPWAPNQTRRNVRVGRGRAEVSRGERARSGHGMHRSRVGAPWAAEAEPVHQESGGDGWPHCCHLATAHQELVTTHRRGLWRTGVEIGEGWKDLAWDALWQRSGHVCVCVRVTFVSEATTAAAANSGLLALDSTLVSCHR